MAKSARSSDTKRNHRNLRAKVFGPAHDARTARLSAKLQELAAKPRADDNGEKLMELDDTKDKQERDDQTNEDEGIFLSFRDSTCILLTTLDMELDSQGAKIKESRSAKGRSNRKGHKVSKKISKRSVVFASEVARQHKIARGNKSRR
jgi:hypothetical protein